MKTETLIEAVQDVLRLLDDYARPPNREMLLDGMLYAYLEGRLGFMSRQCAAPRPGAPNARADFRRGTTAPVVIEFAVRPPTRGGQLYGSQNKSELQKLVRIPQSRARGRVLLLIDLAKKGIPKEALRQSYDAVSSGPGNFKRHAVRVIYISRSKSYGFSWP